jgi:hypothetical protein
LLPDGDGERRHERVMDWITSPIRLIKAGVLAVLSFTAMLLGLGVVLAVADSDISQVLAPIVGVIQAIRWTVWFLAAYGALPLLAGTPSGVGRVKDYLEYYGVRSSVAHGGRSSRLHEDDFLKRFFAAVRWCALRLIALCDEFSPTSDQDIDDLFNDLRSGVQVWP